MMKKYLPVFLTVMLVVLTACSKKIPAQTNTGIETTMPASCQHNYAQATCTAPKTCLQCGATEGEALGHSWMDATCLTPKTCSICAETEGQVQPQKHSWKAATCIYPKTCSICSATRGKALGHTWTATTCDGPQICSTCHGHGEAIGHHYVSGECDRVHNGEVCADYDAAYCPKLYFTGDLSEMTSKKDVREITFEYRSKDQIVLGAAKIKVQGTSSLKYTKKNYTIQFYEDSEYSDKLGIDVGWGAQTEYCLKANWIDKTHARNVVTARIASQIQSLYDLHNTSPNHNVIDGFPVEVYINGSFHGLYTMNIPKDAWMFAMDEDNTDHIVICGEKMVAQTLFQAVPNNFRYWSVEVGPENKATLEKVKRLVSFVGFTSDETFVANFDQYLDLDATLNYYIMMDYAYLPDNVAKNMLLVTYDGKVWYPNLYDLDTSWGARWNGKGLYNYKNNLMTDMQSSALWERIERLYSQELAERYFELRSSILDEENVMRMFEDFYNSIPAEVLAREEERWAPIPGYDLSQIQAYLDSVIPRLDEKYSQLKENAALETDTPSTEVDGVFCIKRRAVEKKCRHIYL